MEKSTHSCAGGRLLLADPNTRDKSFVTLPVPEFDKKTQDPGPTPGLLLLPRLLGCDVPRDRVQRKLIEGAAETHRRACCENTTRWSGVKYAAIAVADASKPKSRTRAGYRGTRERFVLSSCLQLRQMGGGLSLVVDASRVKALLPLATDV
ncbi:MAG: hypothetical protein Q9186_004300 [Xanthomendoza sp. 1 TL-2023]